jgi:hypothetical protein
VRRMELNDSLVASTPAIYSTGLDGPGTGCSLLLYFFELLKALLRKIILLYDPRLKW